MSDIYLPSKEESKKVLTEYYNHWHTYISLNVKDENEREKLLKQLYVKLVHSFKVSKDGTTVMSDLNMFHSFIVDLSYIPFLTHDKGRFPQIALIKNMSDSLIKNKFPNIKDHGILGKRILKDEGYITKYIPDIRLYDFFTWNVVGYHVPEQDQLPRFFNTPIDIKDKTFLENNVEEIFSNNKHVLNLISYVIKIVKDVDRFDIYNQIINGDISPDMNPDKKDGSIHPEVFNIFYSGEYLDRSKLNKQNRWTTNTSQLLWWSFLYHTTLVSTINIIKKENMLEKMWNKTRAHEIDELKEAYKFVQYLLNALIDTSENGILTNPNQAIDKTRQYMGMKPLVRKLS